MAERIAQPDPLGQAHGGPGGTIGITHQERLRAGLQTCSGELAGTHLAAEPVVLIDNR